MDTTIDMNKLGIDDLEALGKSVARTLAVRKREQRRSAFEAVEKVAVAGGLTKSDLQERYGRTTTRGKKSAMPPKYQDPESDSTWTGKGRRPAWVADFLKRGGELAALEIKEQNQ